MISHCCCIGYFARRISSTSIQLVLFLVINYCGKSILGKNFCHSCIRLGQEFFTHNFVFPITYIGIKKIIIMRKTTSRIFFGFTMLCFSMISVAQVRPQTTVIQRDQQDLVDQDKDLQLVSGHTKRSLLIKQLQKMDFSKFIKLKTSIILKFLTICFGVIYLL